MDKELLIALRRFSTGKKIHSLAMWAGIRYGIVDKITQRVFMAIHSSRLKEMYICWPVDQERKKLKNERKHRHVMLGERVGVWLMVCLYHSTQSLDIIGTYSLIERATIQ